MLSLEYFYKVNCSVNVRFWHISFQRDCLNCWLVKRSWSLNLWASCGESNIAKSLLTFRIRSLLFWREKNLSPNFGVMVYFFGLGRFWIYWVVGLLKSFLTRGPLNVGRLVENSSRISNMASRGKTHTFGRHVELIKFNDMALVSQFWVSFIWHFLRMLEHWLVVGLRSWQPAR
jgi:hypothetical protein